MTSFANIMIAASHKRVLENVCNNDDDTIAKDFL
jgi:hypothetical protein